MTSERDRDQAETVSERSFDAMTMGYELRLIQEDTIIMCPLCGHDVAGRSGLAIVQRPSGDVVCEACAKDELAALFIELCVLRDDTPTDFPDRWPAIETRLSLDHEPDGELSRLLASVHLQRDPSSTGRDRTDDSGPVTPST